MSMHKRAAEFAAAITVSGIDVERMIAECIPGGSIVDPQLVADMIRNYCNNHAAPPRSQEPGPVASDLVARIHVALTYDSRIDGALRRLLVECADALAAPPQAAAQQQCVSMTDPFNCAKCGAHDRGLHGYPCIHCGHKPAEQAQTAAQPQDTVAGIPVTDADAQPQDERGALRAALERVRRDWDEGALNNETMHVVRAALGAKR